MFSLEQNIMDKITNWFKSRKQAQTRPDSRITLEGVRLEWDPVSGSLGISHDNPDIALSLPLSPEMAQMMTLALTAHTEQERKSTISDTAAKEIATRLMAGKGVHGKDWNFDWDGQTLVLGVYENGHFKPTQELSLDELKKSFPNASHLV